MSTQPGATGASKAPRFGLMLGLLALLAFAIREHFVLSTVVDVPIRGDIREYVACAWNLVTHGVFGTTFPPELPVPDDYRSPGYPWLIALGMKLWPQEPTWSVLGGWYPFVLQMQVLLGSLSAVFAALLARHWLSATWSIVAGVLLALWPHHVASTNALLSEVVFGFCIIAALYAFARAWSTGRMAWWIAAGVAFGYGFLVNPLLLFFPPCLAALAWWHGQRKPAAILLAIFLVPVLGMGLRNANVDSAGRGSAYRATLNFVQGSWPNYHPAAVHLQDRDPVAIAIVEEINSETEALRADLPSGLRRVGARMTHDPGFHARWYATKPWLLWGWSIRIGAGDIYFLDVRNSPFERSPMLRAISITYRTLNPLFTTIALVTGVWLMFLGVRRRDLMPAAATGALTIYVTLVHEVLQAEPRYATPYRGMEVVLVVTALAWGWQWLQAKRMATTSSSGASTPATD